MGSSSGSKNKGRKGNDKVDLKPISRTQGGGGSGGSSTSGSSPTCPTGFDMLLPEASKILDGARLTLRQKGDSWIISSNGQEITSTRKDRADMLTRCLEKGYRYEGTVRIKNGRRHGEFTRS